MLIDNASKIIEDIVNQNKLIPEVLPDKFFSIAKNSLKRFYVSACRTAENKTVFLKVLINDNPEDKITINNEISLYKYLSDQKFNNFRAPHLYSSGLMPAIWYIREYIEGGTIADMHFILEEFIPEMEKYSEKSIKALIEMSGFLPSDNSNIDQESSDYFLKRIEEYDKYVSKYIPDFKKLILDKFEPDLKNAVAGKIIVHGDFHLENLFFEENELIIADWERVHLGQIAEDFASFWVSLWQVPEIQKKLFTDFYNQLTEDQKNSFNKNINSMILIQSAKEFQHWIFCKDTHRNPRYKIETVENGFQYFQSILNKLLNGSFTIKEAL